MFTFCSCHGEPLPSYLLKISIRPNHESLGSKEKEFTPCSSKPSLGSPLLASRVSSAPSEEPDNHCYSKQTSVLRKPSKGLDRSHSNTPTYTLLRSHQLPSLWRSINTAASFNTEKKTKKTVVFPSFHQAQQHVKA